jgi:hypothetical protein
MLMARRIQLGLSADQVAQLIAIEAAVDEKNRPFVQQFLAIRQQIKQLGNLDDFTSEKRALYNSYSAQAKPPLEQIERNTKEAAGRAIALLTESQKQQLHQILRNRSGNRGDRSGNTPRVPPQSGN